MPAPAPTPAAREGEAGALAGAVGWFFLRPEQLPERWRARAQNVVLVPLLPHEAAEILGGDAPGFVLGPDDEPLAGLVARGASIAAIGDELGLHPRTVSRRIARLRDRLGVETNTELVALLAQTGFGTGASG